MSFLEEEEMDRQQDAEYQRARKRAMYLLGDRDYSAAALREKLLNNYSEETADRVIGDMKRYGFINDEEYAKKLAAYLIKNKKYGAYQTKMRMQQKGVPKELAETALKEYERDDYTEQLTALVRKKYRTKITDPDDRRRTTAALARRGYGFSEIKEAVLTVLEEIEEEEEQ